MNINKRFYFTHYWPAIFYSVFFFAAFSILAASGQNGQSENKSPFINDQTSPSGDYRVNIYLDRETVPEASANRPNDTASNQEGAKEPQCYFTIINKKETTVFQSRNFNCLEISVLYMEWSTIPQTKSDVLWIINLKTKEISRVFGQYGKWISVKYDPHTSKQQPPPEIRKKLESPQKP